MSAHDRRPDALDEQLLGALLRDSLVQRPTEAVAETHITAALEARDQWWVPEVPAPAPVAVRREPRGFRFDPRNAVRVLVVTTVAMLSTTVGLAAADALPRPVQHFVSDVGKVVGLDLPLDHANTAPTVHPTAPSTSQRAAAPALEIPSWKVALHQLAQRRAVHRATRPSHARRVVHAPAAPPAPKVRRPRTVGPAAGDTTPSDTPPPIIAGGNQTPGSHGKHHGGKGTNGGHHHKGGGTAPGATTAP